MLPYFNLPQALTDNARFCCWNYEDRDGRTTKVPYNPVSNQKAKPNDSATFASFDIALKSVHRYSGLGFRVSDDICALDLDHCFSADKVLKPWAQDIVNCFAGCYMERSPSGNGLRILFRTSGFTYDKAKYYINNQSLGLEVYVAGVTNRFVTVTGNVFRQGDVLDMTTVLRNVLEQYMLRPTAVKKELPAVIHVQSYLSDESVIKKAIISNSKFASIWRGDFSGYASHSEADMALATMLAFWCGKDIHQMDRLFRQSGLYREKWDRPQSGSTYGRLTLERAISSVTESYTPGGKRNSAKEDFADSIISDLHPESNDHYSWSDIGNSRLFADLTKPIALYVPERKMWFFYDGKRWVPDTGGLKVMALCKKIADKLLAYAVTISDERLRNTYIEHCRKWQLRRNRETILKDSQDVYPICMEEFDNDPHIFNCANGTLYLKTMEFKPHNSEDKLTKISKVKYDPDARCERFIDFISETMSNDKEKARFLQKILGYGISGDTRYECLFIFYGATTRNGKGTLAESVLKVVGDYGRTARPETISLKQNNNSSNPTEDIARLAGVRFANISEPSRGLVLNAAQVKSMTGNDTLNARFLHENSFDFRPQFKLYINSNYLPIITDMTLFTSGRVIIIPFEKHFEEEEQDKNLKHEFSKAKSQSAILNWLIEGYKLLQSEGLTQPASVKAATNSYFHESDKIALFVEECLAPHPNGEERTAQVYARYQRWCTENGCYSENMRNFKQALTAITRIERKRPRSGGSETTLLLGYKLITEDGIIPL
ncbi:MAG TPA: phage/plasmid primase, P4 family [Oscillospiraceae bacterium]|nr:phage/plasmid primase, P4 family [Oscillospiraceae bacterium]